MSRIKMIFWIIVFIIALILVILNESKRQEKVFKETLIEYPDIRDYENVSGIIKTFHIDRGGVYFRFTNDSSYSMIKSRNYLYSPYFLGDFLREGDSISKLGIDSLIIFRSNKQYYFIIGKSINKKDYDF